MVGKFLIVLWVILAVITLQPPNDPPSAPAGVGLARGYPVYAHPPVSYEDRFSPEAIGPQRGHSLNCQCLDCYPYVSAVNEACEGVGE